MLLFFSFLLLLFRLLWLYLFLPNVHLRGERERERIPRVYSLRDLYERRHLRGREVGGLREGEEEEGGEPLMIIMDH